MAGSVAYPPRTYHLRVSEASQSAVVRPGGAGSPPAEVYLHIGLPKTGTTYLQGVLWDSRERLASHGVLVPGKRRMDQSFAVWDLLGRRPRDADQPGVAGSWATLVDRARSWGGSQVLVSEELLAMASPRQAARAVKAFAPAPVHVVVTVRDLARVVVAAWQQEMVKGRTWSLDEYVAAVRDPSEGKATAGVAFWLRQDTVRLLEVWAKVVASERVHLVTVPQPGAPAELLLDRFVAATGLPPGVVYTDQEPANESVGVAETEVLRRLNQRLDGTLNERQYVRVVKRGVHPALQARRSSKIEFPAEHRSWVIDASAAMVTSLRGSGYAVAGDLDDLLPVLGDDTAARQGEASDSEVADAALDALASVVQAYATSWWQGKRRERAASAPGVRQLASSQRALAYRARLAVLGLADRNRLARWVVARRIRR